MSRFVNRLMDRQSVTSQVVTPRLRSKFEPEVIPSQTWAMETVVKAAGEQPAAPERWKEKAPDVGAASETRPDDQAKEAPGRPIRTEEKSVKASDRSAVMPASSAADRHNQPGGHEQPEEKKRAPSGQPATKQETAVVKPSPEAIAGATDGRQDRGHGQHGTLETIQKRGKDTNEEGASRKKIMTYERLPEAPAKKETRPRDEGWQGRGLFGEAVAGGQKRADPSLGMRTPEPAPLIRVSIGRIEVYAIHPPSVQPARTPATVKPKMTLDDFLKKRNEL